MKILFILFSVFITTTSEAAEYIGGQHCVGCHSAQADAWRGSHHDLAMQPASETSVVGDFNNVNFKQFDVVSTFFKKGAQYWVRTDGPDGQLLDYQIKYTFGVYPLQQYLVEFPGGRLQVLDIAWDSRSKLLGGQHWYHLHPEDKVGHEDVLHWTGPNLNWNYMCADCHSTNLKKNYNAKTQTYDTTWTDIDVSCEACHGPGSDHLLWAKSKNKDKDKKANNRLNKNINNKGLSVNLNERRDVTWHRDVKTGTPLRSVVNNSRAEIQVCARCHSRRSQLTDNHIAGQPFMDAFHPALLETGLYYADGQMQDEVYVWGSFRQSKMYQAGVTCSDCHDPHSAKLKVNLHEAAEQVCYQCHDKKHYAQEKHHFHKPGSSGSSCTECHMPATTFMGVDKRNDHSFRIPRPTLSADIGTPNACNQCHKDKTPQWSATHLNRWLGQSQEISHAYANIFFANQSGQLGSQRLLLKLAIDKTKPAIVRATALSNISGEVNQNSFMVVQQGLLSEDELIRQGALDALRAFPLRHRILAFPLVWDDTRSVRIQAARLLAGYPMPEKVTDAQKRKLQDVIDEYIESQTFNAERPEAQVNLGDIYVDLGVGLSTSPDTAPGAEKTTSMAANEHYTKKSEAAFRKAIQLQASYIPAYINFSQSLTNRDKEEQAKQILSAGIKHNPDSAILYHALGLSQVRQKNIDAAVISLARAANLAPDNRRYAYVYAVAVHSTGNKDLAIKKLGAIHQQYPDDVDILYTLVNYNRDAGRNDLALKYARKLGALMPDNAQINELINTLNSSDDLKRPVPPYQEAP